MGEAGAVESESQIGNELRVGAAGREGSERRSPAVKGGAVGEGEGVRGVLN